MTLIQDTIYGDVLKENLSYLSKSLYIANNCGLVNALRAKRVLMETDYNLIEQAKSGKCVTLISILQRKPEKHFALFIEALNEENDYVVEELNLKIKAKQNEANDEPKSGILSTSTSQVFPTEGVSHNTPYKILPAMKDSGLDSMDDTHRTKKKTKRRMFPPKNSKGRVNSKKGKRRDRNAENSFRYYQISPEDKDSVTPSEFSNESEVSDSDSQMDNVKYVPVPVPVFPPQSWTTSLEGQNSVCGPDSLPSMGQPNHVNPHTFKRRNRRSVSSHSPFGSTQSLQNLSISAGESEKNLDKVSLLAIQSHPQSEKIASSTDNEIHDEERQKRLMKVVNDNEKHTIKPSFDLRVVLGGEFSVGKTSLLKAYYNEGRRQHQLAKVKASTGLDMFHQFYQMNGEYFVVSFSDIPGSLTYRTIFDSHFTSADAVLLVYDVTDTSSIEKLKNWLERLEKSSRCKSIPITIVGNKIDDQKIHRDTLLLNYERCQTLIETYKGWDITLATTSATEFTNVITTFEELIQRVTRKRNNCTKESSIKLEKKHDKKKTKSKCTC